MALFLFLVATVACLVLAPSAMAGFITPESGGSPNADQIDSLYKIVLYIAAVVFAIVLGTLLYSVIKFRAKKGAVAAQIHGNTRLEVGWTIAAALILVVLWDAFEVIIQKVSAIGLADFFEFRHQVFGNVEIGIDGLDVVIVLEHVDELEQRLGHLFVGDRCRRGRPPRLPSSRRR